MGELGVRTFPKDNNRQVNAVARLEFELTYFEIPVQYSRHYATVSSPTDL